MHERLTCMWEINGEELSCQYYIFIGFDNHDLMLTPYVPYRPLSSMRIAPTIFERVYIAHQQRPTALPLHVQWLPAVERSNTYRWTPSDIDNRTLKTKTFFENKAIREQPQPKAVTPPSSDYTDAYLSAFAPKPIPTKRYYRIAAPVFANVAPIKTHFSIENSIRTSQTRFNPISTIQTSNLVDRVVSSSPNASSTYSPSLIPDISTTYIQSSSPPETVIHVPPQPSPPTVSTTGQSEAPLENVLLRQSSSTMSTYKPSVAFQSAPASSANNIHPSSTNEQVVLPSSKIERPETLLFQHDEDIQASSIEKPSPIITPLLESPITRIDSTVEPERIPSDELSIVASKPIEIMENTLDKYDSVIDQISEILASVSPLSSTVSSMSPGKSVLDYELTADGSPILQRKHTEPQLSQPLTTVRNTNIQRVKVRHLIREDSYDKIRTAIADLDNELSPPPEVQTITTTVIEEEPEEPTTSATSEQLREEAKESSFDKQQTPPLLTEKKEDVEITSADEQQILSSTEWDENERPISPLSPSDISTNEAPPSNEIVSNIPEFVHQQTDLLSILPSVKTAEETGESNDEDTSSKKSEKHVTWGEPVVTNEEDESSSSLSWTEESNSFEAPVTTARKDYFINDEAGPFTEQPISASTMIEESTVDDQFHPPPTDELLRPNDQQITSIDPNFLSIHSITRKFESSSSPDRSSSFSDSVDRQTTSSDLDDSRSSDDEPILSSKSPETASRHASITQTDDKIADLEETTLTSLPMIQSPINTLADSISTRFTSSDVYHGYLGDHTPFIEVSEIF